MAKVVFTSNLMRHLPAPPAEVAGATVREVLLATFEKNPLLRGYILDDQGHLRKHMVIFVDGEIIRDRIAQSDAVSGSSEVYVMQALSGG